MDNYSNVFANKELTVWLDLSTYCNAGCPQCHRTNPVGLDKVYWLPLVQWTLEDFKKAFDLESLQYISKFDICGTWGDPVMVKDIFYIIEYIIKNSKCEILLQSNGSIREEEWWWDLGVMCGNRLTVQFAIEGITQEQHSKYRQKTNLNKTLKNMYSIGNTKSKVIVYSVVFEHNERNLVDIAKLCMDNKASHIVFVPSNRFHRDLQWFDKFYFYNDKNEQDTLVRSSITNTISGTLNPDFIKRLENAM